MDRVVQWDVNITGIGGNRESNERATARRTRVPLLLRDAIPPGLRFVWSGTPCLAGRTAATATHAAISAFLSLHLRISIAPAYLCTSRVHTLYTYGTSTPLYLALARPPAVLPDIIMRARSCITTTTPDHQTDLVRINGLHTTTIWGELEFLILLWNFRFFEMILFCFILFWGIGFLMRYRVSLDKK